MKRAPSLGRLREASLPASLLVSWALLLASTFVGRWVAPAAAQAGVPSATASPVLSASPSAVPATAGQPGVAPSPLPTRPEDIMTEVYNRVGDYSSGAFSTDFRVHHRSKGFMRAFLPTEERGAFFLEGSIQVRPGDWDISIHDSFADTPRDLHFTSEDGYNLSGQPYASESSSPTPSASASPSPSASASASPDPSASPSASPSAEPSASPSPQALGLEDQAFNTRLYRNHVLTLLWPFQLKQPFRNVRYELKGEESVPGYACWHIDCIVSRADDATATDLLASLWVDRETFSIVKIEWPEPEDRQGPPLSVQYAIDTTTPLMPDGRRPFYPYTQAVVTRNGDVVLEVEFKSPKLSATAVRAPAGEGPATASPSHHVVIDNDPIRVEVVFTTGLILVIVILAIALSYYGGRYLIFLLTRTPFSRDLLLVEQPGGPLKAALEALGYSVETCSMELLGEERNYLGKKVGDRQARAVVIAPNAFHLVKSYLFLARAYVEEGGRIFVLNHPPSAVSSMPFTPYFVSNSVEGRYILLAKSGFWKRLRAADVQTKTASLMPKEFYVEINQRKFDVEVLAAQNQATGARGVGIGVYREGKGEYLVCQFTLAEELTRTSGKVSAVARLMMLDLLDFLQARKPDLNAVIVED